MKGAVNVAAVKGRAQFVTMTTNRSFPTKSPPRAIIGDLEGDSIA